MNHVALLAIALAVLGYAAVSGILRRAPVSSALIFAAMGALLGKSGLGVLGGAVTPDGLELVTTATLVLVLYSDASQLDVALLRREASVPLRLLGIGLPLTILAGFVASLVLLPQLAIAEALLLAVILAPTDAALGQAVVTDERLPSRIRQGLNTESGLNDGICVPLLGVALALVGLQGGAEGGGVVGALIGQVGWGAIAGIVGGLAATLVLRVVARRFGIHPVWRRLVTIASAALAYALALGLNGSGFIAAFVAGLVFRLSYGSDVHEETDLVEESGSLLAAVTFLLFGAVVLPPLLHDLGWMQIAYAAASLTLVRMVPVAVSLIGGGFRRDAVLLMGWFGPRGLASIVFALIAVKSVNLPHAEFLLQVVVLTILGSVVLHGISAVPLVNRFVRANPQPVAETEAADASPSAG
jgi:NhaP-type Na+/H+ or K+/H+ antiporter